MSESPAAPDPTGLTAEAARARLAEFGPNAVPEATVSAAHRIARHLWAPVPWMLEAVIVLQLAAGEFVPAAMIALLLTMNAALGFFQEARADATLRLLRRGLALKASVLRDSEWIDVAAAGLVPGDAVRVALGGVVPADLRIVSGTLLLDQSMLTGESMAVEAGPGDRAFAGALIRRGHAVADVVATGARTYFGRAAELVRVAHVESTEQKAVVGVVRALTAVNFVIVVGLAAYARWIGMETAQIIPLVLTAMLSAVPAALPATFTLASALGARRLADEGVLLTRLTALHEAAGIDVLCVDKTGTLTENVLSLAAVKPLRDTCSEEDVLALAAAASAADGQDPIDRAILAAAPVNERYQVERFLPFDPATKIAEALVIAPDEQVLRVVKGSPIAIGKLVADQRAAAAEVALETAGQRTIAVAAGPPARLEYVGLIGFSDQPRADSAALLRELQALGVRVVMITGDTAPTASAVARSIGLTGALFPGGAIPETIGAEDYAIFAGVFPEDKFHLIRAYQSRGHVVAMCGDGANDAPALRQAQMGIAVSTATDVAKSAAGLVLSQPGLSGIVTSIREGRSGFQRILTYTLSILVNKCVTLIVLGAGLLITGHAVLTPLLQGLWLVAGDFVTMARAADHAEPTPYPNVWRVRALTFAAVPLAATKLVYCVIGVEIAWNGLRLDPDQMRTFVLLMLILAGQATTYVLRERRHFWLSRPAMAMMAASAVNVASMTVLATLGYLMTALPVTVIIGLFGASSLLMLAMDAVKVWVLKRLPIDRSK